MIKRGDRYPRGLHRGGRKQHAIALGGRVIYISPELGHTVMVEWLKQNTVVTGLVAADASGEWLEMEVTMPPDFTGSPETGWTNGPINLSLHYSKNLTLWTSGGWISAPGKPTQTLGNGWKKWFVRYEAVARIYKGALVDFRLTTTRQGKSITALNLNGVTISLPGYPYAMPAQAATLQTHLLAAGYAGATVTTTAGTWSAVIQNYAADPTYFTATWSGSQITEVRNNAGNALIALPGYPYTMPAQEAALEAALIAAGFAYAQVTLHLDEWVIFLPNITTVGLTRSFEATITPADPVQTWTFMGTSDGVNSQAILAAVVENPRTGGVARQESDKAFGRLGGTPV